MSLDFSEWLRGYALGQVAGSVQTGGQEGLPAHFLLDKRAVPERVCRGTCMHRISWTSWDSLHWGRSASKIVHVVACMEVRPYAAGRDILAAALVFVRAPWLYDSWDHQDLMFWTNLYMVAWPATCRARPELSQNRRQGTCIVPLCTAVGAARGGAYCSRGFVLSLVLRNGSGCLLLCQQPSLRATSRQVLHLRGLGPGNACG